MGIERREGMSLKRERNILIDHITITEKSILVFMGLFDKEGSIKVHGKSFFILILHFLGL